MDFVDHVAVIARTKSQIKELQDQLENLYAALPQSQKPGSYPAGDYILKVRDNFKFDPATAAKALTDEQVAAISVAKPDATQARKVLSGNDYERCQKRFGVIREVVAVTDEV